MKSRLLLLSAAVVAIGAGGVFTAAAQPHHGRGERHEDRRIERRIEISRIDANGDKFITRAEAQGEAERVFADMDDNHDGKLDATDHGLGGGHHMMRRVEIRRDGGREVEEDIIEHGVAPPAPGTEDREVIIRREVRKDGDDHGDRGDRSDDGDHVRPPHPPHPPVFMMIFANSEEADRNGDNALSKDEFVNQQLRFFDAADANGDGRIKFDPPPMMEPPEPPQPPQPPAPPAPPQPPRR